MNEQAKAPAREMVRYRGERTPEGLDRIEPGQVWRADDGSLWSREVGTGAPLVGVGAGSAPPIGSTVGDATCITAKEADDAVTGNQNGDGFVSAVPPAEVEQLLNPNGYGPGSWTAGDVFARYGNGSRGFSVWRFSNPMGYALGEDMDPTYQKTGKLPDVNPPPPPPETGGGPTTGGSKLRAALPWIALAVGVVAVGGIITAVVIKPGAKTLHKAAKHHEHMASAHHKAAAKLHAAGERRAREEKR
jgi:hypothetical protein